MPIASTLEPLTDSQVAAYRRLPGDFGTMLQVCFNDGWNGCHAHMKEEIVKLDSRVAELETTIGFLRSTLHNCASHAGLPDPASGCRAIIATVKDALSIP